MSEVSQEKHPYIATAIALILILFCLWAAQWQYQRGVDRHQRNAKISENVNLPTFNASKSHFDAQKFEWRLVSFEGHFDPAHQILLRNRYNEGKYGFNLLTLFVEKNKRTFWVNRGWIAPGVTAESAPKLPNTPTSINTITGRLRLDNSLPQGSFFALPTNNGSLIEKWNAQSRANSKFEVFYVDLLKTSDKNLTPRYPVDLPELSDGPHLAYALQWLFFAGLVIYGRLLLRRSSEVLTSV